MDPEVENDWDKQVVGFKQLMDQIQEQMLGLRAYDAGEEIDAHCDDLMSQITLSVESTMQRISRQGNWLLERVESYRKELKDQLSVSLATHLGRQIEGISAEFDTFYRDSMTQVAEKEDSDVLNASKMKAHEFSIKIGKAKQLTKAKTFQNNRLIFKEYQITSDMYEYGSLEYYEEINFNQGI